MTARRGPFLWLVLTFASLAGVASAQEPIEISIEKHARLSADGGVVFRVHVTCDPLPGNEEFREATAGAIQGRTGAEAEGGLTPDVMCDGVERVHTAALSAFTDETFRRGPAGASVSVIACNTVGDDQVCVQSIAQRRIVITGRPLG